VHGHRIAIVPGLACTNSLGAPDVMRGEETQIVGAVALSPELASGRHLIALPGTHCKWVELADGTVERFQTAVSGELYSVLRAHSILIGVGAATFEFASYEVGVRKAIEHPEAPLHHLVFEARSRQLRSGWTPAQASAFLSGLIVGSDVRGAVAAHPAAKTVYVIGAPEVAGLYSRVLEMLEIAVKPLDGSATAVAGLRALAEEE
jgi:2-dehydro-3-deoxygalactonokinase